MTLFFSHFVTMLLLFLMVVVTSATVLTAQDAPVELRFLWYSDGVQGDVMRGLLDTFEANNPDITVAFDVVTYSDLHLILDTQLSVGNGPDLARITDFARFHGR